MLDVDFGRALPTSSRSEFQNRVFNQQLQEQRNDEAKNSDARGPTRGLRGRNCPLDARRRFSERRRVRIDAIRKIEDGLRQPRTLESFFNQREVIVMDRPQKPTAAEIAEREVRNLAAELGYSITL